MPKLTKAESQFEHPAKGPNHCSMCRHFDAPHGCSVVRGHINAEDWCKHFKAKSRYNHPRSQRRRASGSSG